MSFVYFLEGAGNAESERAFREVTPRRGQKGPYSQEGGEAPPGGAGEEGLSVRLLLVGRGGPSGSRLPEVTRRAILLMKEANPGWGVERISDLLRGPALPASPQAVARVLHEAGYELEETPTRHHPDPPPGRPQS